MTHERSKKRMMGQVVGSLYYLDPTVIPRLKSLRSGDDSVFSFGVLFYALKRNPRRVVQHVDDAAPFKSVFLDQMLHDLIVRMRIDAQVRGWIVTAVVLFFYRLNKKRYNEIVEELKNGRKS